MAPSPLSRKAGPKIPGNLAVVGFHNRVEIADPMRLRLSPSQRLRFRPASGARWEFEIAPGRRRQPRRNPRAVLAAALEVPA